MMCTSTSTPPPSPLRAAPLERLCTVTNSIPAPRAQQRLLWLSNTPTSLLYIPTMTVASHLLNISKALLLCPLLSGAVLLLARGLRIEHREGLRKQDNRGATRVLPILATMTPLNGRPNTLLIALTSICRQMTIALVTEARGTETPRLLPPYRAGMLHGSLCTPAIVTYLLGGTAARLSHNFT